MRTLNFVSPYSPVECRRRLEQLVAKRFFRTTRGKGLFRNGTRIILNRLKIESETPAQVRFRLYAWGDRVHITARGHLQAVGASTQVRVVFGLGMLTKLATVCLILFPILALALALLAATRGHFPEEMVSTVTVIPVLILLYMLILVLGWVTTVPALRSLIYKTLGSQPGVPAADRFESVAMPEWLDKLTARD
jgi:hypothetical protein